MNDFHFLRPVLLWLLAVPAIYIIGRLFLGYKQNRVHCIISEMRSYLVNNSGWYKEIIFKILPVFGIAVGILALAGPVWEKQTERQPEQPSIALVIHLPENCPTNDIAQMKIAVYQLLDSLRKEQISLSVQSGSTHLLIPYTNDYRLIRTYTELISPDIMPARGDDLEGITKVTTPPVATSFHTVVYITPSISEKKVEQWNGMELSADYKAMLTAQQTSIPFTTDIVHIEMENEGVKTLLATLKQKAEEKMRKDSLQDSTQWKDRSYLLCIPATLLLLPLFLRYKKNIFFLTAVLSLSSCTYTERMWNEAQVNFYLMKGDTLQAIRTSEDPFRRGMLWIRQQEYTKAARELAQDSTSEALYNRALSIYRNGYFLEARSLLKEVERRKPDWTFASDDREVIEKLIATQTAERSSQENRKETDEFESFEKDKNEKSDGNEAELWADKLMNEAPDKMNYRGEKALKRSEVLFRQIENNPKEFIRRRLEYEYAHKE